MVMNVKQLIDQIKPFKPKRVILFGSRAYGEPGEGSDFDVAIIKETDKPFHDRVIEVRRLVRTTMPIDFFVFTEQELAAAKDNNPFVSEIVEKGRVVYEQ